MKAIKYIGGIAPLVLCVAGGHFRFAKAQQVVVLPAAFRIPEVSRAPRLQDFVTGVRSEAGTVLTDFRQREPGDGTPVSQKTAVHLSRDSDNLYVVFVCRDEPAKIRAHMSKRDDILDDDRVTVYIDSFHDRKHAYVFSSNPLGVQADALLTDGSQSPDYSYDTLWRSQGRLTIDGYVVWMAIPFKSLRFARDKRQSWGIALSRSILRNGETAFVPSVTLRKASFIDQLANVESLASDSAGHNIQVSPYASGTGAQTPNSLLTGRRIQSDVRGGMDAKVVFDKALTLDVTANPDFSQVETDDPQVTINKRYATYFPEKRPFFIEDANYFTTPVNLFFTRKIVDPEFGARLTGRVGQWSLGVLTMDDRAPGVGLDRTNPLSGDHALIGAVRVQRDFGGQSQVGLMVTNRSLGSSWNRVASFDTRIKLSPTWFFAAQAIKTLDHEAVPGRVRNNYQGNGYSASISHSDRHFAYTTSYLDLRPEFRSTLGFVPRVDMRQGSTYLGYFWRPEGKPVLDYGVSATVTSNWNHQGRLQDLNSAVTFQIDFTGPAGLAVSRYKAYEVYLDRKLQYGNTGVTVYTNALRWLNLSGSYALGSAVNYYPSAGIDPFVGTSRNGSFGLKIRPAPRVRIEEIYYYSQIGARRGLEPNGGRPAVFNDHLMRTILNYQFTKTLSLRGIIDYSALLSNPSLFNQETTKQLTGDILLTYLLNPGTAIYIGYNSSYENLAVNPNQPPLIFHFGPFYETGRQIFIKLTYRFRL